MLIDSFPQIVKSAIFIEIGFSDVGVHQGDELRLVQTEIRDDGRNFFVLGLRFVVGQVIAEGAAGVDLHITALDVVEKDFSNFLVFLGERCKRAVQIGQGDFLGLFVFTLQDFQILRKARVHVVGVDLAGVDFGDVAIDVERNAFAPTASTHAKFFVTLKKRQILMVANGELDLPLGIFVELINWFLPRKPSQNFIVRCITCGFIRQYLYMTTEPKTKIQNGTKPVKSLTNVLVQSEHVRGMVEEAAEELSTVNKVLKQEIAERGSLPEVENAIQKNKTVEIKVEEAAEELLVVNQALENEVNERHLLEHQLAAAEKQEKAARHVSFHDPLTGLPNRVLFNDRLEHGLAQAKRHNWTLAVMFMDLNGFKGINDTYGHDTGDSVLRTISQRLKENRVLTTPSAVTAEMSFCTC